jgi:hypothetical protein
LAVLSDLSEVHSLECDLPSRVHELPRISGTTVVYVHTTAPAKGVSWKLGKQGVCLGGDRLVSACCHRWINELAVDGPDFGNGI